jgi:hypothetical protein
MIDPGRRASTSPAVPVMKTRDDLRGANRRDGVNPAARCQLDVGGDQIRAAALRRRHGGVQTDRKRE